MGKALIGIDESTTSKSPTAKRTKNILTIGELAKYRRILTGSPVTKSPLDLYSQCEFLDSYLLDFSQTHLKELDQIYQHLMFRLLVFV